MYSVADLCFSAFHVHTYSGLVHGEEEVGISASCIVARLV